MQRSASRPKCAEIRRVLGLKDNFRFIVGIQETVKLVQAAGGTCYGYVCDLCDREDIYKKAAVIREEIGKVINI